MRWEKFVRRLGTLGMTAVALGMWACTSVQVTQHTRTMIFPDLRQAEIDRKNDELENQNREDLERRLSSIKHPQIVVDKKDRVLEVLDGGTVVRKYPVGLGIKPEGDKIRRGDHRTPEGTFFICGKNAGSKFHKSLLLSYPSVKHAEAGLVKGLIGPDEYQKITEANKSKQLPPQNTPLGGAVCLHGGGGRFDWTAGCVALNDRDMDELFSIISVGTPVTIMP